MRASVDYTDIDVNGMIVSFGLQQLTNSLSIFNAGIHIFSYMSVYYNVANIHLSLYTVLPRLHVILWFETDYSLLTDSEQLDQASIPFHRKRLGMHLRLIGYSFV